VLGVALALIVLGIILLFVAPWVGIVAGIVGLLLAVAYVAGIGRRADRVQEPGP
jgi:hypothetical protein